MQRTSLGNIFREKEIFWGEGPQTTLLAKINEATKCNLLHGNFKYHTTNCVLWGKNSSKRKLLSLIPWLFTMHSLTPSVKVITCF